MIKEVSKEWLKQEAESGRKHWTGRFRNANKQPVEDRFFVSKSLIGNDEEAMNKFLANLMWGSA